MKKDKPFDKSVYRSLALVTQLGITMLVSVGMMCALGIYLDRRLGTGWITVVLFFVGAIAGGQSIFRTVKHVLETSGDDVYPAGGHRDASGAGASKEKEAARPDGKAGRRI